MTAPATEPMCFIAFGINHKTAPVDLRERVAFTPAQLSEASEQLRAHPAVDEVAVLSTCNRTELYGVLRQPDVAPLLEWMSQFHHLDIQSLAEHSYVYTNEGAVGHLMRVACGLDSMVLGEPQILGQIKDAYDFARETQLMGNGLDALFQSTFSTAKRVRSETGIGAHPVSVAYAAVNLAQRIFSELSDSRALLIGAGDTIELVARHLFQAGIKEIVIANRTVKNAEPLADEVQGRAVGLERIPHELEGADIVISSTAADLPLLGKGMVERALKVRRHKPMFMVDIAVPRDIEPQVAELDDVFLFTVDDLQEVINENMAARREAAEQAEGLIQEGVDHFIRSRRVRDAGQLIRRYREQAQTIAEVELAQALSQLQQGQDPEAVLKRFARGLTNKWLHEPTVRMRQASADNRQDLLLAAGQVLGLDADEPSQH